MVVISPRSMPHSSCSTFASGARQLVVQEALEMTVCFAGSYSPSLTPMTTVTSSFLAGAEMMTFFAPPSTCTLALVASVKMPVDSITTSAPRSPHGNWAGSRSANEAKLRPSTLIESLPAVTSPGKPSQDGVVLQQVGQRVVVGEVVDAHDLDVGAGGGHGPEVVPADPAEAVDAHAYGHCTAPSTGRTT